MARPREFDTDIVLDALRDVFWKNGYEGTSYADIIKATGLKKGSLYAAFGDKRSLYQQAISRYDNENVSAGIEMLRNSEIAPEQRLKNLLQGPVDSAGTEKGRRGCLLCNAAIDQAPFDKDTETSVTASMRRLEKAIEFALEDMSQYKDVPKARQAKAASLLAGYFGLRVFVKAGVPKSTIEKAAQDLLEF